MEDGEERDLRSSGSIRIRAMRMEIDPFRSSFIRTADPAEYILFGAVDTLE